jgi:hypothetical protein
MRNSLKRDRALAPLATPDSWALECPTPEPAGARDAISELPAQINELADILASGDLSNRIPVYVRALRARHPNVSAGELVSYLVTAYCPVTNPMAGLSEAEKGRAWTRSRPRRRRRLSS